MCEFASFVLTLDRELWGPTESHEDIIAHHQLHADGARGPNILRVELTPPHDPATREDLATWCYRVDQDLLPEWAEEDPGQCAQRARAALSRRAAEEYWFAHVDSQHATAGYAGTATAGDAGTATAGYAGEIRIRYWDPKSNRYRVAVGYVGEDGVEPNVPYIVIGGVITKRP